MRWTCWHITFAAMRFVHPEILWALGALSIPILVHLFNFRKFRKVYFSNVSFLREIQVETQSKSRLKHLLILLMRMLAVACIVFAFAQPYIPLNDGAAKQGDRAVSLYVDNSFSMEGQLAGAPLLEIAKNKAIEVARSFGATDKFQVLTNDFEGRHQRLVSREEAIDLLQEIDVSPASRKMSEVFTRQKDILKTSGLENLVAFQFSDLQTGMADPGAVEPDSTVALRIVPTQTDLSDNVAIDSVWFTTPVRQFEQTENLRVRLINTGEEAKEQVSVELIINGAQKAVTLVDVPAKSSAEAELVYTHTEPGTSSGTVRISDYPISFDDTYHFGYEVLGALDILGITENTNLRDPVWAVFGDDPYYRYRAMGANNLDYSQLGKHQLVILNQLSKVSSGLVAELSKYVTNGGSLCIIPSPDVDFSSYNELLGAVQIGQINARTGGNTDVSRIEYEHELFEGTFDEKDSRIDLPKVTGWYALGAAGGTTAVVLSLRNGLPFLTASNPGSGRAYFFSVPLDAGFSNLSGHAVFPASMLRMAVLSAPSAPPAYTLGKDQVIEIRNRTLSGEETFRLRETQSGFEFIPAHRNAGGNTQIFTPSDLNTAGNYAVMKGDEVIATTGFNFNRSESVSETYEPEELLTVLEQSGWKTAALITGDLQTIGSQAAELEEGRKYWWTMIIWALIFLAAEILLIKYWR
jgi:hypothetical protein